MKYRYDKEASFEWLEKTHKESYLPLHNFKKIGYEKLEDDYFSQGEWLRKYTLTSIQKNNFEFGSKTIKEVAFKIQELAEEFVSKKPEIIKEFVSALQTQEMIESRDDYKSEDFYDEDSYDDAESLFKETSRNFQKLLVAQVAEYFHNKF